MPGRSDEAAAFSAAVYGAVQEIPRGKVTTYGHIAALIAQRPRQVGISLKHLPIDLSKVYNDQNVPWQRVVNAKGAISPRSQAEALQSEDVAVEESGGEFWVDFGVHGWFPSVLPSEAVDDDPVIEECVDMSGSRNSVAA